MGVDAILDFGLLMAHVRSNFFTGSISSWFVHGFANQVLPAQRPSSATARCVAGFGSTSSSLSAKSGNGLAAAKLKATQKSNDNAIHIAPSTSSVVAMFVSRSMERTISNIAARPLNCLGYPQAQTPGVQNFYYLRAASDARPRLSLGAVVCVWAKFPLDRFRT